MVLHFHLSEAALGTGHAVVRPEDGGPLTLDELVEFLGRTGCHVRIQPVLDPTEVAPIDGYEIPQRLRAAVRVRQIADVFPFGTCLSPKHGSRSHRPVCGDGLRRAARSDPVRQSGPDGPARSSSRNPRRVEEAPARARVFRAPLTHRLCLPGH